MKEKFWYKYKDIIKYLMLEGELCEIVEYDDFKRVILKLEYKITRLEKARDNWKNIADKLKKEK